MVKFGDDRVIKNKIFGNKTNSYGYKVHGDPFQMAGENCTHNYVGIVHTNPEFYYVFNYKGYHYCTMNRYARGEQDER
jgi:hypothetical protein